MNKKLQSILLFLGFAIPYILIYKVFFQSGSLAFGDAPFFAPENLKELFSLPFTWNFRNDNFGSPQFYILWLYLPTYLYGLLNHYLNFNNDVLIRVIFYFPATILAIFGAWKFIGKFNPNIYGKFFGSFLYGFNTYFLMLVDGGQVGVALAYGLFPFTVLGTLNYLQEINIKKFGYALLCLFILFNIDIRIGLISIVLSLLIWLIQIKNKQWLKLLINLCVLGFSVFGLCLFWILPIFGNFSATSFASVGINNNFVNLINSLFLFQPHFPLNQFGKLSPTPFYFCLLLILILGNLMFLSKFEKTEKKIILKLSLLFLLFAFIAKGGSEPLGELYLWMVNFIPGGVAFRDSTKFYIPLILVGGLLFSFTISGLEKMFKGSLLRNIVLFGIYGYLIILIHPALLGNLSGALGSSNQLKENDYKQIFNKLNQEQGFFRTLYIEEKPAKFYGNFEKPAISANNLYKERPFASMIVGKYDLYNFFHNSQLDQWLKLLGIKYIFLPENERKKVSNLEEQKDRSKFLDFIDQISWLKNVEWNTSYPIYNVPGSLAPHIFGVKNAYFIIGSEEIYNLLFQIPNFSLMNQGFVFLEEGTVNLKNIENFDSKSLILVFFNKNIKDLEMSYFVEDMISVSKAITNQWKVYSSADYLIWKYELLKQGIDTKEFDFNKGIAISTVPEEKINFNISTPVAGQYFLAVRFTNSLNGKVMLKVQGQEYEVQNKNLQNFKWEILGPIKIVDKQVEIIIINKGNFALLNTLILLPENQFKSVEKQAKNLTVRYKTIFLESNMKNLSEIESIFKETIIPIDYKQINPTQYQLTNVPQFPMWIIFSDHYNKGWVINNELNFPFYSIINGFYIKNSSANLILNFLPQETIKVGIILSLVTGIVILGFILYIKKKNK